MPPINAAQAKSQNSVFFFVILTVIIDMMGVGLIWPILPKLVEDLTGSTIAEASTYYGWVLTGYALVQFLFAPLLGVISDRFGRRPVLLLTLLALTIDYILMSIVPTFFWLFIARLFSGFFGATFSVANACIADITPREKRAAAFGKVGAAIGLGFIIGPMIGGYLGSIDLRYPFYFAAILAFANLIFGYFMFPETLSKENRSPINLIKANPFGALAHIGQYKAIFPLLIALFFVSIAQRGMESIWVLWTGEQLGWGIRAAGYSLTFVGVCVMFAQGFLIGKIMPVVGEANVIRWGYLLSAFCFLGFAFTTQNWIVFPIIFLFTLGNIATPALQSIASSSFNEKEQGLLQGTIQSVQSLAMIIGPFFATMIFSETVKDSALTKVLGGHWPGFYFIIGFGLYILAQLALWLGRSSRA